MFREPAYTSFYDVPYESRRERESAKNTQLCTMIAVISLVVLVFTTMPLGCSQYPGGPRTSLVTAMKATMTGPAKVAHAPDMTEKQVEEHMKKNDCTIMVYADWCGHCTNLAELLSALRSATPKEKRTQLITVNEKNAKNFVAKHGIKGFPACLKVSNGKASAVPHTQEDIIHHCVANGEDGRKAVEALKQQKDGEVQEEEQGSKASASAPEVPGW